MESWRIIGIDCAVDARNVAVAHGELRKRTIHVYEALHCGGRSAVDAVAAYIQKDGAPTLLAFDAPLGWPVALGRTLADHRAGDPVGSHGHALFRRMTDVVVKAETGQQPLDIGADRIARTAAATLAVLDELRARCGRSIPLAWTANDVHDISAIEVYPAATLRQIGIVPRSYKKRMQADARATIVRRLAELADIGAVDAAMQASADVLDAVVCVIAGADFLCGRCRAPSSAEIPSVKREGWIWFRT